MFSETRNGNESLKDGEASVNMHFVSFEQLPRDLSPERISKKQMEEQKLKIKTRLAKNNQIVQRVNDFEKDQMVEMPGNSVPLFTEQFVEGGE